MLVVDTSALLNALVAKDRPPGLTERLSADGDLHAPHLIDVEIVSALRRLNGSNELTDDRAADALSDFAETSISRYPHTELRSRAWEMRHNLTAYDAMFVALAEQLGVPLVTCCRRLAHASGHDAMIELYE